MLLVCRRVWRGDYAAVRVHLMRHFPISPQLESFVPRQFTSLPLEFDLTTCNHDWIIRLSPTAPLPFNENDTDPGRWSPETGKQSYAVDR